MKSITLKEKSINAIIWSAIQSFLSQGISFLFSVLYARVLSPNDFGLLAMGMIFFVIGESIVNSGLSQSLIRSRKVTDSEYSSILYFNVILSFIVYTLFYFLAPLISDFYNQPLLTNILRVYFVIFIIKSFSIVQNTVLVKSLKFKSQFLVTLPSIVISGIFGYFLAISGYGIWSLICAALVQALIETIQYWVLSTWKPSGSIKLSIVKPHLKFGYKLTISSLLNAIISNLQSILIGKYFSPNFVGLYNRANTFKQFPSELIVNIVGKVSQPVFAQIQEDNEKLKKSYKIILQTSFCFVAPILLYIAFFAKPFFLFVLTDKWSGVIGFFRILCFSGILYPIHVFNLHILNIKGRSDLNLKLEIIKAILTIIIIIISLEFGVLGILYGSLILSIISIFINSYYTKDLLGYSIIEQLKDLIPYFFTPFALVILVYLIDFFLFDKLGYFVRLTISLSLYFILNVISSFFTKPYIFFEVVNFFNNKFCLKKHV